MSSGVNIKANLEYKIEMVSKIFASFIHAAFNTVFFFCSHFQSDLCSFTENNNTLVLFLHKQMVKNK